MATLWGAIPAHLEWKRDWQPLHSSSGNPETPGQYGVQGVTVPPHGECCTLQREQEEFNRHFSTSSASPSRPLMLLTLLPTRGPLV